MTKNKNKMSDDQREEFLSNNIAKLDKDFHRSLQLQPLKQERQLFIGAKLKIYGCQFAKLTKEVYYNFLKSFIMHQRTL